MTTTEYEIKLEEFYLLDSTGNPTGALVSGEFIVSADYDHEFGGWIVNSVQQNTDNGFENIDFYQCHIILEAVKKQLENYECAENIETPGDRSVTFTSIEGIPHNLEVM